MAESESPENVEGKGHRPLWRRLVPPLLGSRERVLEGIVQSQQTSSQEREEAKRLLEIEETVRRVEPIFRHPDQNFEELKALFADLQKAANTQYRLMFEVLAHQAFFTDAKEGGKRLALSLPPKSPIQDLRIDIGLKRGVLAVEAETLPLLVVKENPRDYNQDYFQPQHLYLSAIDDDKSFIWAEFGIDLSGEVNYVNITEGKARVVELEGGKSVAAGFLPESRNECMISFVNPYSLARLAIITANFGPMSIKKGVRRWETETSVGVSGEAETWAEVLSGKKTVSKKMAREWARAYAIADNYLHQNLAAPVSGIVERFRHDRGLVIPDPRVERGFKNGEPSVTVIFPKQVDYPPKLTG